MTTIYLAAGAVLAIVRRRGEGWRVTLALEGSPTQCVAIDPLRPERVNCGTFGRGLWRSEDAGTSWRSAGEGIPHAEVMSVAVSRAERTGDHGVLWVGTEPSAVFRSEDGARTGAAPGRPASPARSTTRTRWRYTLWRRAACMKRQAGATPRVWTAAPRGDASTAAWSTTISGAWRWTPRIQI